jgi:hypothetical protein
MKNRVFNYSQVFQSGGKVASYLSFHQIQKPLKPTVYACCKVTAACSETVVV